MVYPTLFLKCLKVVLRNEGGYVNHPNDPGGETNKGITHYVYNRYRKSRNLPEQSVKLISKEEVYDIYYSIYWNPMDLDDIENEELILQVFDFGVNAGIRTSIKLLQRIIGVDDDGYVGKITLTRIKSYEGDLLAKFTARRKIFYMNLVAKKPELEVFLKGWLNRVEITKF
jgi:lysozyme family protein